VRERAVSGLGRASLTIIGPHTKPKLDAALTAAVSVFRSSRLEPLSATMVRQTVDVVLAAPISARDTITGQIDWERA